MDATYAIRYTTGEEERISFEIPDDVHPNSLAAAQAAIIAAEQDGRTVLELHSCAGPLADSDYWTSRAAITD